MIDHCTFIDKETGFQIDPLTISVVIKNESYRRGWETRKENNQCAV